MSSPGEAEALVVRSLSNCCAMAVQSSLSRSTPLRSGG
ncbi:MAG: hypothetical protein QOI36_3041 [Pseudonocardiales bacterium]|nr:hypothetical protein [Pseudonocardiales bacterium]